VDQFSFGNTVTTSSENYFNHPQSPDMALLRETTKICMTIILYHQSPCWALKNMYHSTKMHNSNPKSGSHKVVTFDSIQKHIEQSSNLEQSTLQHFWVVGQK